MNKDTKRYLKEIRTRISCGRRQKAELMEPFLRSVQNYALENGAVSYNGLVDAFGTPEEMAEMVAEKLSDNEIHKFKLCKKILKRLFILLVCFMVLWSIHVLFFANAPVEVVQTIIIE